MRGLAAATPQRSFTVVEPVTHVFTRSPSMSSTDLYQGTAARVRPRFPGNAAAAPTIAPIVFVMDDDVSVRDSIEMFARTAGWRAEAFRSAAEFFARPRSSVPCCLVLDVGLPRTNSLDMQQRLAADRPE